MIERIEAYLIENNMPSLLGGRPDRSDTERLVQQEYQIRAFLQELTRRAESEQILGVANIAVRLLTALAMINIDVLAKYRDCDRKTVIQAQCMGELFEFAFLLGRDLKEAP